MFNSMFNSMLTSDLTSMLKCDRESHVYINNNLHH